MTNVYEPHYQIGLFTKKYYAGNVVLANDIGVISFLPDAYVVDIVGLGDLEVAGARRAGEFTREWLDAYSHKKQVRFAVVHDSWFWDLGIPQSWVKLGDWTVTGNIPFIARTVSFYAVDSNETENLRKNLKEFSESELPQSVKVKLY